MLIALALAIHTLAAVPDARTTPVCAAAVRAMPTCFPNVLTTRLQAGMTRESFVLQVLQPLRSADRDEDGLDAGDLDLVRQRLAARERAQRVQSVLGYDLNGDLRITRAEALRSVQSSTFGILQVDRLFQENDSNGDGVIDLIEVAAKPPQSNLEDAYELKPLRELLALGTGGRLTARALQEQAERCFDAFDADRNGILSADEMTGLRSR